MSTAKDKRKKETVVATTIVLTITIVALYFIVSFVGKNLLKLEITDSSAIFLSLIPFVVYLVVSGRIKELKGGGFEIQFKEAFEKEVLFEHQQVEFDEYQTIVKGSSVDKKRIISQIAEKRSKTLALRKNEMYDLKVLRDYLEGLTEFESPKYVVFIDKKGIFEGFVSVRSLLAILKEEKKELPDIINKIAYDDLDGIPGFRKDFIQNIVSNREVLNILDKENLTDIAVVDTNGKFLGFASRETITIGVVKSLLGSASE